MNANLIIAGLTSAVALTCLSVLLVGGSASAAPSPTAFNMKGIRAEYEDLYGNHHHTDTICYVTNTSLTQSIKLERVLVLGPRGIDDVIGVDEEAIGTVLGPLAELRVFIDDSIPGVTAQDTENGDGVRSVFFEWSGPADAMRLTGTLVRSGHSATTERTTIVVHGYDIAN